MAEEPTNALGLDFSELSVEEKKPEQSNDAPSPPTVSSTQAAPEASTGTGRKENKEKEKPYLNPERVKTGGTQRDKLSKEALEERMTRIREQNEKIKQRRLDVQADEAAFRKTEEVEREKQAHARKIQTEIDVARDQNAKRKMDNAQSREWDSGKSTGNRGGGWHKKSQPNSWDAPAPIEPDPWPPAVDDPPTDGWGSPPAVEDPPTDTWGPLPTVDEPPADTWGPTTTTEPEPTADWGLWGQPDPGEVPPPPSQTRGRGRGRGRGGRGERGERGGRGGRGGGGRGGRGGRGGWGGPNDNRRDTRDTEQSSWNPPSPPSNSWGRPQETQDTTASSWAT